MGRARLLKSTDWLMENANEDVGDIGQLTYSGTEFANSVQSFLRNFIDKKEKFKDNHRSRFNQHAFKEIKVGAYGSGFTFGDIDAHNHRKYLYTLRVKTSGTKVWSICAKNFFMHLESLGKIEAFKTW